MNVPEKLINFRVYQGGDDLVGIADVTLPNLEAMTETVKGAGIAGEIDSRAGALLQHGARAELADPREIERPPRIAQRRAARPPRRDTGLRPSAAAYVVRPVKVVVSGVPKTTEPGKLDVGTTSDTKNTIEVNYMKITIDGEDVLELDKYNYICRVGGKDYLAEVRDALGLA